jgi:bifunctional oligoribonuclease and PAP phosphatase NrnA
MGAEIAEPEKRNWDALIKVINSANNFVLSSHLDPDADALGSELAFARYLKAIGKKVTILHASPIRENIQFLIHENEVNNCEAHDQLLHDAFSKADVLFAFDIGDFTRLGIIGEAALSYKIPMYSIDHHHGNKLEFTDQINDPTASSTGFLVYELIKTMDPDYLMPLEIAEPLYVAVMSDTGNFRFNNADAKSFRMAADCIESGINPNEYYVKIYDDLNTVGRIKLMKILFNEMILTDDKKLAYVILDKDTFAEQGIEKGDTQGISDYLRSFKGVEIGCSFLLSRTENIDVSMRSKGHIKVNTLANKYNGGGHYFAAGCQIPKEKPEMIDALIKELIDLVKDY